MFNKALFKQSVKAHFSRWLTITLSTSLMLMVIILVLGNMGGIGGIKSSLTNIFTTANEESSIKENAIDSYEIYLSSVDIEHNLTALANGNNTLGEDKEDFKTVWNTVIVQYQLEIENFEEENGHYPTAEEKTTIRTNLAPDLIDYFESINIDTSRLGFSQNTLNDMLVCIMEASDGKDVRFEDDEKTFFKQSKSILTDAYVLRIYNSAYQQTSARENASEELINKTSAEMRNLALQAIESYTGEGVDATFDISLYEDDAKLYVVSMLYDIASLIAPTQYNDDELKMFQTSVKILSDNAINNYQIWLGEGFTKPDAREKSTASLTDQIPDGVTKALTELGAMDLSGLIVGGMFYNMAGLLLPLVFVITTANALLAGQVDSGSMAYVLSTPTKRRTVTFTQMIFLISSLFAMFLIQTICGEIALACVDGFGIDYKEILLLNIGAFFTCFAFAGVCFMCSAIFNRSKHSISVGGGFTIFSLVCTILGLFGSNMMPSIMRISAMNAFNYLSIITFFDVSSILSGAMGLIWKMAILAIIGITGFVVGIFKFEKKDLPL